MTSNGFKKPYYAVIFSSKLAGSEVSEYEKVAERMVELSRNQPGFLGIESVRGSGGNGITISYWESEMSILNWKANSEHLSAQARGRAEWYESYEIRVCKVEREYEFEKRK